MKLIHALKRMVGRRLASSTIVQNALCDQPGFVEKLSSNRPAFEKMLANVSENPESFYRVLADKNVRKRLRVQKGFLKAVAFEESALHQILGNVSRDNKEAAVRVLVGDNTGFLKTITDTPEALAAALMYNSATDDKDSPQYETSQKLIVQSIVDSLGDHAPAVITEMANNDPDLITDGVLRKKAIGSICSDDSSVSELFALYASMPKNGHTPGQRIQNFFEVIFKEPIFAQSMIEDENLRHFLLRAVKDTSLAAHTNVEEMLAAQKSPEFGKANG